MWNSSALGALRDTTAMRLPIAILLLCFSLCAVAEEPPNKLNLCSRTRQTAVNEVSSEITDAAKAGDIKKMRAALKAGISPNATTDEGFSLLHIAITEHHNEMVDLLIKSGADVNQPFMGSSPLSLARTSVRAGETKADDIRRLDKLVKAGAKLSDFDEAFFQVIQFGFRSIAAGFIDAMTKGDMARLELYVRATYEINEPLNDGISPLHIAAIQGTPEAVRYLVSCGANVNARTKRGAPVLWFAKDRPDIRALLVQFGATEKD